MTKRILTAMVAALVTSTASPALAQAILPGGQGPGISPTTSTTSETGRQRSIAVARDDISGGFRAPVWGDNSMGVIAMDDYVANFPAPRLRDGSQVDEATRRRMAIASFERIESANVGECGSVGEWIREQIAISAEIQAIEVELGIARDQIPVMMTQLDRLRRSQRRANTVDTIASVVGAGLLCAVPGAGWAYCAAGGASALGRIGQTQAHGQTQRVDGATRRFDLEQRLLHLRSMSTHNRAMMNHSRAFIGWARSFHGYCMTVFPNQTSGLQVPANNVQYGLGGQ